VHDIPEAVTRARQVGDALGGQRARFDTVIVTYRSEQEIADLLDDLRRSAPAHPIVLVDNASPDGTAEIVRARYPEVTLVANRENVGYARAANQGIAAGDSPFVFLLNPDIRLPDPAFHEVMLAGIRGDPRVAAVGPLQVQLWRGREHLNHTWSYWSPRALAFFVARSFGLARAARTPLPTAFLNAGCLLLRRSAFEEVGGFDERFFLYGEEPDLFLKFRRYGYRALLLRATRVVHLRERSIRRLPLGQRWRRRLGAAANISVAVVRGVTALALSRGRRGAPPAGAGRPARDRPPTPD
jgi:GT2 family glycosyltransferase